MDYEESIFKYSKTKRISENTIQSTLMLVMSFFENQYIDKALLMRLEFELGKQETLNELIKLTKIDSNTTEMYIRGLNATKIYESEMLSLIEQRDCNVDVRIKVSKITAEEYKARVKQPYDQEVVEMHGYDSDTNKLMVFNNQNILKRYDESYHPIYKLQIYVTNNP
jgi:hypothetical protein